MDSAKIITSINQIYDSLNIKQDLRDHMLKVAGIGASIVENWNSDAVKINSNDIIAVLLLHDIGNVAKFNFDEPKFWTGHTPEEIEYWKRIKRDTLEKYGTSSDKELTLRMAEEVGAVPRLLYILEHMGFSQVDPTLKSSDFDLKICMYADQRVGPSGVISIEERFRDLRQRYGRGDNWRDEVGLELERQVFAHVSKTPDAITNESVRRFVDKYSRGDRHRVH